VEAQAAYTPVELRVAAFRACEHNVKYKECQKYAEHADKFEHGSSGNVAVALLLCRLDKSGKHHAEAKKIAEVGKVNVEIPTDSADVVEDSEAGNCTNEPECTVNGLKNKLCCSVFNHDRSPFDFNLNS
jgi:hypothetical protein